MTHAHSVVQLDDVQAHIIRGAKPAAARYYFLRIEHPLTFAGFLQQPQLQAQLLSEQDIRTLRKTPANAPPFKCFINLAFTYNGMKALGLPDAILQKFPPAYQEGMAARAKFIGDEGIDSPANWDGFYGGGHIHVLVGLNYLPWLEPGFEAPPASWSEQEIQAHDQYLQQVWQSLCGEGGKPAGAQVLMQEAAHVIREHTQIKEHFGFADGVSQPYVRDGEPHRGGGGKKMHNDSHWEPLAAGEFLVGYQDEIGVRNKVKVPGGGELLPPPEDSLDAAYRRLAVNGSFLVYRKLRQRVKEFRRLWQQDGLPTQLVGRDPHGVPLTGKGARRLANEFDFADDPKGEHCPFAAHMRRVNPRLTLSEGEKEGTMRVDQHRLIRRAMPYGPFIPTDVDVGSAPDVERGLHFFCYNARIDSQFEFVQKNWLNNCDFMRFPSPVIDPIAGNRHGDSLGQFSFNQARLPVYGLEQYVQVLGGDYFFTPGKRGLALLLQLVQQTDPFWKPKQRVDTFNPKISNPFEVEKYVDFGQLLGGKRFVKLWVEDSAGARQPYYYFAYPQDMDAILAQPNVFTNVLYQQRIEALTGGQMLLSQAQTPAREQQKNLTWKLLKPADFSGRMQQVLGPELVAIRKRFLEDGKLELVEHLARRLPLAIVRDFYGIAPPPVPADGILSKIQIAQFYDRTDYDQLPGLWQRNYREYGFSTTPDDTLLFWIRMLFLQVFGNVFGVSFIAEMAQGAAAEFLPQLDGQIRQTVEAGAKGDTLLVEFIRLYQSQYHYDGDELVMAVRQSILELAVGSTDTTAKGIAMVVKTILQFGPDLLSGLCGLLAMAGKPEMIPALQQAVSHPTGQPSPVLDAMLEELAILCLYQNPVAPLVPRYCLNGATYTTSVGDILNIEPGAMICLVPEVTLGAELRKLLPFSNGRYLFMDNTPHACMGRQIALLEMREALKLLLSLPSVRPAAGKEGQMQDKYGMPASMWLRCG